MSVPVSTEKRMLTATEFELVQQTHYPDIRNLSKDDLTQTVRRIREYRNKARDTAHQQRREMRGKSAARGARPARDDTGTSMKNRIFAGALRRVNGELARLEQDARRASQGELARKALELKRANRVRHHPSAGRTAHSGMQPVPNEGPTLEADAREIGRVSQAVKVAQARRDG